MRFYHSIVGSVLGLALTMPVLVAARTVDPVQQHNSSALWFENRVGLSSAKMTISGPNGTLFDAIAPTSTPVFELDRAKSQDRLSRHDLNTATEGNVEIVTSIDTGREALSTSQVQPFHLNRAFVPPLGVHHNA